jgi:hypothetical protein
LFYSASIIEDLVLLCDPNPRMACAYFFFDGRDGQKELQTVGSLIRSLIRQFSTPYGGLPATLTKLFHSCHDGGSQPTVKSLQATLILILEAFDDVYIVLDALDECAERKDLLKWITEMICLRKDKLHLLVTSRPEEVIAMHLLSLNPVHVCMEPGLVKNDITRYIDSILDENNQWSNDAKATIKSTLMERAGGMYVRSNMSISLQPDCCSFIQGFDWLHCKSTNCKNAIMNLFCALS